jgi:MFS family permease
VERHNDPRWRRVATLALTETVSWGVLYYAFSALVVPMEQELSATRGEISLAFSVAVVLRALASPLAGLWVDRGGVRSLMTTGSIAGVLLTLAWSSVGSLLQLYVVFAGIGVVTAMVLYEPAFAAVARWMRGDERATAVLWITIAAGFASTIFLPVAATLTDAFGWRGALRWLAVVVLFLTVVPHALLTEPSEPEGASDPDGPGPRGEDPGPAQPRWGRWRRRRPSRAPQRRRGTGPEVSIPTRAALRDPTFRWITLTFVCGRIPIVAVSTHLPALLVERGETATIAATIAGGIGALSVTGRIVLTVASRWTSLETLLASLYAVQAGAVLVLAFVPGRVAVLAFVVAFGLGFGATTITKPVMVAERYGPRSYGAIAGIIAAVTTAGEAASPVLVGWSRDLSGIYRPSLVALAVVLAVGVYAAQRCATAPPPLLPTGDGLRA